MNFIGRGRNSGLQRHRDREEPIPIRWLNLYNLVLSIRLSAFYTSVIRGTMALSIKHPEADRLARELADKTGETLTVAILTALRERLERVTGSRRDRGIKEDIVRIQQRVAAMKRVDDRTDEELLGYDESGLPSSQANPIP